MNKQIFFGFPYGFQNTSVHSTESSAKNSLNKFWPRTSLLDRDYFWLRLWIFIFNLQSLYRYESFQKLRKQVYDIFWTCTLECVTFFQTSRYQGILKATVPGVFEDLKFKISEGSDQNWSCPDSALLAVSVPQEL